MLPELPAEVVRLRFDNRGGGLSVAGAAGWGPRLGGGRQLLVAAPGRSWPGTALVGSVPAPRARASRRLRLKRLLALPATSRCRGARRRAAALYRPQTLTPDSRPHRERPPPTHPTDPWWDTERSLLSNLMRLPRRTYLQLFHYSRPDTVNKVIRAPEWASLKSEWRYIHRCAGAPHRYWPACRRSPRLACSYGIRGRRAPAHPAGLASPPWLTQPRPADPQVTAFQARPQSPVPAPLPA
jgi:hypothetical protein